MAEPSAQSVLQGYLQRKQFDLQNQVAQQQHDEAQAQLKELHEYHSGELEKQNAALDLQRIATSQAIKNAFMEHVASGLISPQGTPNYGIDTNVQSGYAPNMQDSQGMPIRQTSLNPSLFHESNSYDLSNVLPAYLGSKDLLSPSDSNVTINTPEQQARIKANTARIENQPSIEASNAIERGKVAANMPVHELASATTLTAKTQEDAAALERAKISANARIQAAKTQADARRYAANVNANSKSKIDPDELSDAATMSSLGLADLPMGANKLHVLSIQKASGLVPFEKKNGEQLNSINDLDGIFQDMRNLLPQLATTKVGGTVQGLISHIPISTDFRNSVNQINARLPQIVRNVEGVGNGRITMPEINASKLLLTGGNTQAQASSNIDKLERDVYGKIYSNILGSVPINQKISILQTHGMLDKFRKANVSIGGKSYPVITRMQDGNDGILDMNNKQYVEIKN